MPAPQRPRPHACQRSSPQWLLFSQALILCAFLPASQCRPLAPAPSKLREVEVGRAAAYRRGAARLPSPLAAPAPLVAAPSAYPSSTALSSSVTLRWRVDADASPPSASFLLEAVSDGGPVWLGMGRAACDGMLNRRLAAGERTGCSAPVVVGQLTPGAESVGQVLVSNYDADLLPAQPTLLNGSGAVAYDAGSQTSTLAWSRPLAATGDASELALNPFAPDGYIWAVGDSPYIAYHADKGHVELSLTPSACTANITCSARGVCDTRSAGCICAAGYARDDCSVCASGFVRGAEGRGDCVPGSAAADATATIVLRLTDDFSACCASDANRTAYGNALAADVARALGLPAGRLAVTALAPGSVIATLALAAGAAPSAPAAALALAAQWANRTSPLYAGAVTAAVDAATPPTFGFTAPPRPDYTHSVSLATGDGAMTLSWTLDAGLGLLALRLVCGGGARWCAVGVNDKADMPGGDVAAIEVGRTAGAQLNQYTLDGFEQASVHFVPDAQSDTADELVTVAADGVITATWTRPLAAGAYAGARAVPAAGATTLVWASGPQGTIAKHTVAGAASVNFATGDFSGSSARAAARLAHGALMFCAWALLAPAGVFLARFAKRVPPVAGPRAFWFVAHYSVQSAALAVAAAGFGVALSLHWARGEHFASAHGKVGLAVLVLAALQPLNACVRPLRGMPDSPMTTARLVWEVVHKGAGWATLAAAAVAIVLGLRTFGAAPAVLVAYGGLIAITVAAGAALTAYSVFWVAHGDGYRRSRGFRAPVSASTDKSRLLLSAEQDRRYDEALGLSPRTRPPAALERSRSVVGVELQPQM